MTAGGTVIAAALGAAAASYVLTGLAVRVALATGFVDRPEGYKGHLSPTPYLGGAAVICAALGGTLLVSWADRGLGAVLGCAVVLAAVGTIDDRVAVPPRWRVLAELTTAAVIFAAGIHWAPTGLGVLDFALSAAWVVGVVNAFNLMDNLDGATATVTSVSAGALGVIALSSGQTTFAVAAVAVVGACIGFLPHNLAGPARIFLGDGGSMPLGFIIAGLSMAILEGGSLGASAALAGGLVAGLTVLDTTLVVISRRRRGVPYVTGGRDHLTHRLLRRAGSARRVAVVLALGQCALAGLAIAAFELGPVFCVVAALAASVAGLCAINVLESPAWRPNTDFERAQDREVAARRVAASTRTGPSRPAARGQYPTAIDDPSDRV